MNQNDPSKLIFHYNREHRLEHAPESVRRAYAEGPIQKPGILKGLTANAGLRSIFFSVIILSIAVVSVNFLGNRPDSKTIDGFSLNLKAFLYEDTVYVTLSCAKKKEPDLNPVPVRAEISGLNQKDTVTVEKEISGIFGGKDLFLRTTIPDSGIKTVTAKVKFNKSETMLSVAVDRK
jgi:hypothetical protein